jgi:hypothetical protein
MRQRQMFKLSSTEYLPRAVLLLLDLDTQRVSWLNDLVNAPPIRPCVAPFGAGKVDNATKRYLVIESVRPDTQHGERSTVSVPGDGAGGSGID